MDPKVTDGTVTLRRWVDEDAAVVCLACQDVEIQRWLDVPVPFSIRDAVNFIDEQRGQWASQKGASFAITRTTDGEVLGQCSLVAVDAELLTAQVTYSVSPFARGHGVAGRAVRLLRDWAFREVGLKRLEFYIEPENAASRTVVQRIGCSQERGASRGSNDKHRHRLLYVLSDADQTPTA